MAPPEAPGVKFCYRCGRRVDATRENCWYCSAPTRRVIREPRRCPFCSEPIAHEAIKCRHCGEFLDGRERAQPPPAQQVIYVIDKSVMQGARDFRVLPGSPIPPEVARGLKPKTLLAIEQNRPELIDMPGVRALPAPAEADGRPPEASVIDVDGVEVGPRRLPGPGGELPARRDGGTREEQAGNLPTRRDETPQAVAARLGLMLGKALAAFARWLAGRARRGAADDALTVAAQDPYRRCESCGTEILTADNYCYHCGMQYHFTNADAKKARRVEYPSNAGLYFAIVLLIGGLGYGLAEQRERIEPLHLDLVALGLVLALCVAGFFRRRTTVSQAMAIALALAGIVVWLAV